MQRLTFVAPFVGLVALVLSWGRDLSAWVLVLDLSCSP